MISPAGLCKECLIHFNFFFWFVRVRPPDIQELLLVSVDKSLKFVGNSVNYSWSHRDELLVGAEDLNFIFEGQCLGGPDG